MLFEHKYLYQLVIQHKLLPLTSYIVLHANPTTGGVTASFAMLGDIHVAEPGAIIGFAGRRVIEETVKEKLPEDFQTAEYLKSHGMIDIVVPRSEQKIKISKLLKSLTFYLDNTANL